LSEARAPQPHPDHPDCHARQREDPHSRSRPDDSIDDELIRTLEATYGCVGLRTEHPVRIDRILPGRSTNVEGFLHGSDIWAAISEPQIA
jgi:hypothetical protein